MRLVFSQSSQWYKINAVNEKSMLVIKARKIENSQQSIELLESAINSKLMKINIWFIKQLRAFKITFLHFVLWLFELVLLDTSFIRINVLTYGKHPEFHNFFCHCLFYILNNTNHTTPIKPNVHSRRSFKIVVRYDCFVYDESWFTGIYIDSHISDRFIYKLCSALCIIKDIKGKFQSKIWNTRCLPKNFI